MGLKVTIEVSRDGWTGGIQCSINEMDESGGGHGYRIGGPKFNGSGEVLACWTVDRRDAEEIMAYLRKVIDR